MLAVNGIFTSGKIVLQEKVKTTKPVNVIVTFLEDVEIHIPRKHEELDLSRFSFDKSRELLKDYKGSLSDAVIEERRNAV